MAPSLTDSIVSAILRFALRIGRPIATLIAELSGIEMDGLTVPQREPYRLRLLQSKGDREKL